MKITADGFSFDFPDAIEAFVFDEKNPANPRHHTLPMKAVDIVVVLPENCLFIEMKDMHDPASYDLAGPDEATLATRRANFNWLKSYLKYK